MTEYRAAIFFENDEGQQFHVENTCKTPCNIEIIKIPETRSLRDIPWAFPPLEKLIADNNLYENTYLTFIQSQGIQGDQYDLVSGIQQQHLEVLRKWIERTKDQIPRVALFDWDRTITVFEGNYYPASRQMLSETLEGVPEALERDTVRYLCGGDARVGLIQEMFQLCKDNDVEITILTNNSQCTDYFEDFERLLQVFGDFTYNYICSSKFRSNKGLALQKTAGYDTFLVNPSLFGGANAKKRKTTQSKRSAKKKSRKFRKSRK
jgi:hypothetical protein